jgi:hypothetical protein
MSNHFRCLLVALCLLRLICNWLDTFLLLRWQEWDGSSRPAIVLGAALEAVVWVVRQQKAVAVHADLVFCNYVLFFFVEPLAREVCVLINVSLYLVKNIDSQSVDRFLLALKCQRR